MADGLIVFTRFPEAGQTKTRMIPLLGPAGAAELQRQMTEESGGQESGGLVFTVNRDRGGDPGQTVRNRD